MLPTNIIEKISQGYDSLWEAFIKPPRTRYPQESLGPRLKNMGKVTFVRDDFEVTMHRGEKVKVSFCYPIPSKEIQLMGGNFLQYHDFAKKRDLNQLPTVFYLHSQSGNRTEGLFLEQFCAFNGYGLVLIDFLGCGLSDGKYVTLGVYESVQLDAIITQVRAWHNIGPVALWGRSMGAVTAVVYAERNSFDVSSVVLDSPFGSVQEMVQDIAYKNYNIPQLLVNIGVMVISGTIKQTIGIDLFKFNPKRHGIKSSAPAFFIVGKHDGLVTPEKVKEMCDLYGSKYGRIQKVFSESKGTHNDAREAEVTEAAKEFIKKNFQTQQSFLVDARALMLPSIGQDITLHNYKYSIMNERKKSTAVSFSSIQNQVLLKQREFIEGIQGDGPQIEAPRLSQYSSNYSTEYQPYPDNSQVFTQRPKLKHYNPKVEKKQNYDYSKPQSVSKMDTTLNLDFGLDIDIIDGGGDKEFLAQDSMIADIQMLDQYLKTNPLKPLNQTQYQNYNQGEWNPPY